MKIVISCSPSTDFEYFTETTTANLAYTVYVMLM